MGINPSVTNQKLTTVDGIIQKAIFDVALISLEDFVYVQMPWMKLPIIKQVFTAFLNWIANFIYKYLSQVANFTVIDLQTDQEKSAYDSAVSGIKIAHISGDANALQVAKEKFKVTLGSLIHFDGS
jgi:hypothetical protein